MAILHMDGFDCYSTSSDVALRYPGSNGGIMSFSTTAGRFGGGGVTAATFLGPVSIPATASAVIAGFAFQPAASLANNSVLFIYNSSSGTATVELSLNYDNGIWRLYRGNAATLLTSSTIQSASGLYHHVEIKATVADSGGAVEVRVGGVQVLTYSGDTKASTTGSAQIDKVALNTGGVFDDLYILDTTGSVANDFLGDCRINNLVPTSDSSVQFTKSTGASNFSCVDEGKYNSDTDYVESSTVGHIDKYGYSDLAAGVTTVFGVQAHTWVKKTDAGARTFRNLIYSNASTTTGTTTALTTSYAPIVSPTALNPDGSIQWTPTTVNAALAGFEIVT